MRSLSRLTFFLLVCATFAAHAAAVVDVPGPAAIKAGIVGTSARDRIARQSAAAFVLGNLVRVQAGGALQPAQAARITELENFRNGLDTENEAILPVGCRGRDCEDRYAFNRCISAYEFSPQFYRAIFDKFFDATAQKALAPKLASGAGTVWQDAIKLAAGSQPLDKLPALSRDCDGGGMATTVQAAAGKPSAHDESIKKARAAGVDTTVLGLKLGEPVSLPVCPQQGLFDGMFGSGVAQTCIRQDDMEEAELVQGMMTAMTGVAIEKNPYELFIVMPNAKCPDWVAGCSISGHQVDGKLVSVLVQTKGLDVQQEVAAALQKKYKVQTTWFTQHWKNDVTGDKVDSIDMGWKLAGITVHFRGYTGGTRDGLGTLLVETDATTRERDAAEKARQDKKQQL